MNAYQQYCVGGFPTLNIDLSAIDLWYIVWYGHIWSFKGYLKDYRNMRVRIFMRQNFRISMEEVTYEGSKGIRIVLLPITNLCNPSI